MNDESTTTNGCNNNIYEGLSSPELGVPLPLDEHACSVAMPKWEHVVGYEEGDVTIAEALACGYPRFVYHPYLQILMTKALDKYNEATNDNNSIHRHAHDCILMPSKAAANRYVTPTVSQSIG